MKQCGTCHRLLPREAFNVRRAALDGLQSRCRDCNRAWYLEHGQQHRRNVYERKKRVIEANRLALVDYLRRHSCVDCGEQDLRVLEFDHRPGSVKRSTVVELLLTACSWEQVMIEIEKCDVRCSNCHRRRTAERARTYRQAPHEQDDEALKSRAAARLAALLPSYLP